MIRPYGSSFIPVEMPEAADIANATRTLVPGVRVRHRVGGWTGVVVKRPDDANPGVAADAIWIQPDGSERGPESWAPFATVGALEPYSGPVNERPIRRIDSILHGKATT